jgi:hypothetical protein
VTGLCSCAYYRALKAKVHKYENAVPIQVLRRSTIDRPDDAGHSQATRSWNFATALYYKSGGLVAPAPSPRALKDDTQAAPVLPETNRAGGGTAPKRGDCCRPVQTECGTCIPAWTGRRAK